jgi:hypothetical protein
MTAATTSAPAAPSAVVARASDGPGVGLRAARPELLAGLLLGLLLL